MLDASTARKEQLLKSQEKYKKVSDHSGSHYTHTDLHFALLCFTLLCFTSLCFTSLCFASLCFASLCFASLHFALLCFASLCFASLHFTSFHFASLHFASLHFTSLHFASLHFASLHFTLLHFTLLCFTSLCFVLHHFPFFLLYYFVHSLSFTEFIFKLYILFSRWKTCTYCSLRRLQHSTVGLKMQKKISLIPSVVIPSRKLK